MKYIENLQDQTQYVFKMCEKNYLQNDGAHRRQDQS